MNRPRTPAAFIAAMALAAVSVLLLGVACANESDSDSPSGADSQPSAGESAAGALSTEAMSARSDADGDKDSPSIFVSGAGRVSVEADLAILTLGIEVRDDSVSAAHQRAATAMTAVSNAVRRTGVEERDIQTQRFSIEPVYRWEEVLIPGGRSRSERVLDGYEVANNVLVRVRDLSSVSAVIDEAAEAGGDDVRIHGLRFTAEDASAAQAEARAAATKNALAHARQIAAAAGVELGGPISLSETAASPVQFKGASLAVAASNSAAEASTPIEAGELEVVVTISAVFAIK